MIRCGLIRVRMIRLHPSRVRRCSLLHRIIMSLVRCVILLNISFSLIRILNSSVSIRRRIQLINHSVRFLIMYIMIIVSLSRLRIVGNGIIRLYDSGYVSSPS